LKYNRKNIGHNQDSQSRPDVRQQGIWEIKRPLIGLGIILLLTLVAYHQAPFNDFVHWDDPSHVTDNKDIRDLKFENFKLFFTKYYLSMYHPLTTLSFAVEYHFFGLNPRAYHTTNLILHLANIVLVFYLVWFLSKRKETALIAACLFGIHPMHVESVAWITERKDVLFALFYLGAILSYAKYSLEKKWTFYWISLFLFILSLLSKSAAITLPIVLLLLDWYQRRELRVSVLYEKLPFLLFACLFGIISLISQDPMGLKDDLVPLKLIDRPFLASYALVFYLIKFFVPLNPSALHIFEKYVTGYLPLNYYLAPIPLIVLGIIFWKIRILKREISFGILFFLITISLVLHFLPIGSSVVAERYTYIPYIGLSFILGQWYCYTSDKYPKTMRKYKIALIAGGILVIMSLVYLTTQSVALWKDSVTLMTNAEKIDGPSPTVDNLLGLCYTIRGETALDKGDFEGAIEQYSNAVQRLSKIPRPYYSRGIAKTRSGDYPGALEDYTKAISIDSTIADYYNDRGNTLLELQRIKEALNDYTHALQLNETMAQAYFNRARGYFLLRKQKECCEDLRHAASLGYKEAEKMMERYCSGK